MKFSIRLIVKGAVATMLWLQLASAQVPQVTPFSADMQFSSTRAGNGPRDMEGKVYFSHDQMRMDTQGGPAGQSIIITNFKTQVTDILLPAQQIYMEHQAGETTGRRQRWADLKPVDPNNPCASETGSTCKKVGVEEVNGRTCDHWQITDKNGKVSNAWIDQKLHFPIKTVTEDSTWELTNIKEGEPDASLFEVPAGYHKMDVGGMMGGMGQGPPQQ